MPETILVVDDDESLLEVCEVGLRLAGYEVTTEISGERALKRLEAQAFDLVITDLQMPGNTDGHGVVVGVKARYPSTEVILITGVPTLRSAITTLKDGAYDYIIKPFDIEHLKAVVHRCLVHRQLRQDLISERALRQELESAYRELQKVEEIKEAFLSRLSHEIRTPLTELLLALTMLKPSSGSEKYLDAAMTGSKKLEKTLTDLLVFMDLQKNSAPAATVPVNLESICQGVIERMRPLWEPRQLNISMYFEPETRLAIGDSELLYKAFEYLVHNAIVFNRNMGKVDIRGRNNRDYIEVSVTDTGEGIPESEFKQIFDSFYQIANYMTRKVEGLGLGLAITRRIVEAHQGQIYVSSRIGEGTTFRVLLPAVQQAAIENRSVAD